MKSLPKTVISLGFVSFFTDLSSEMIYPLLPIFLSKVLGAGAVALGMIEGIAESTAALLKLFSGIWKYQLRKRNSLIDAGYGLSDRCELGCGGIRSAVAGSPLRVQKSGFTLRS